MFKFLTSKPLWVNIVAGLVLLLLLLLLFLGSLALLTQHGKTMKIPSVTGMTYSEARKSLQSAGFEVQIQDSVYNDTAKPLQVMKQFPEADNLVKVNRTIYLTINQSQAPIIQMPNLVSMTIRNAQTVLRQYGLKLGDTVYRPDFARNSVLDQLVDGKTIKPGTQIRQGSSITLVLGTGIGGGPGFIVPDLTGLTYQQAKARLDSMGLIFSAVMPDPEVRSDTAEAYIYWQDPKQFNDEGQINRIRPGQAIDIRLGLKSKVPARDSTQGGPAGGY